MIGSASCTPSARRCCKYGGEAFCSPYMNIRGNGNDRNFVIRSPWSDSPAIPHIAFKENQVVRSGRQNILRLNPLHARAIHVFPRSRE